MPDASPMIRRVAAAQATLDRFKDRPLKLGQNDCVRLVAFHLRKLGYRIKLPPAGAYGTVKSALKQLQARGFADLAAAVDGLGLERIAPASAVVGDVILLPGDSALGSLNISVGNGRTIGFHEDVAGAAVIQPTEFIAAWGAHPQ